MIAAFFDFDGTLYTGHVWLDLVRDHLKTRRQRRWVVAYVVRNMAPWPLYKLGLLSQETYFRTWGKTMAWLMRGLSVDQGQALFERLTRTRILPNLRPDVVARLRQHQEQGHLVALVSGTFAPWLEAVARHLEVPHAVGTPLEVRDGRYTGRIVPPLCQGDGKPKRLSDYLANRDLAVEWSTSFAYADRRTDLPLLRLAGHPVAVYPDEVLLAEAQAQGWPIMDAGEP
jgi:HAD superfamily hydrolase (TIGR01490 family)